ncbi:MAG TPA: limonene-1,2-epoxide hydrolase family protein [Mycobacteriales bacterium]|jgi:limonene-1,2-epoxide hydrolase|nr:limonene-1,2-epoxide hydrolase family protein [Mycobacteriales bacterium]
MTEPAESPGPAAQATSAADVVRTFLTAMAEEDADLAISLVAEDLIYENVSLPTIRGKRRFAKGAHDFYRRGLGFDVRIHRITQDGDTVMTERTDALTFRRYRSQFWVCGVFEVHDGVITLWRDYFDWKDVMVGSLRGFAGIIAPSLRASLPD